MLSEERTQSAGAVRIVVDGRFKPHTVAVRAGRPCRLVFRREETSPCSEQVVFPSLGRTVTLPAFEDVAIALPALDPGNYSFTCGRSALHGQIIVRRDPAAIRQTACQA